MTRPALPASAEMERAVLGGVVLDPGRFPAVLAEGVEVPDFHRPEHAHLFDLLLKMDSDGDPIDLVTVPERVQNSGRPDDYGGVPYVVELADALPSTANLAYYARRVRRLGIARRAISACWDAEDAIRAAGVTGELPFNLARAIEILGGSTADTERELVNYLATSTLDRDAMVRVWREVAERKGWRTTKTEQRAAK
jgi:hypothetical protein